MHVKTKIKRFIRIVLLVCLAGFISLNVLAFNHAHAMMFFTSGGLLTSAPEQQAGWRKFKLLLTGVNIPRPTSLRLPTELDPACQAVTIPVTGTIQLGGWLVDHGSNTPMVILCHGYRAEKTSLLPEAKAFLQLGYSVLLIDFRGSGASSEAYTTIGVKEGDDVAAAFNYVTTTLHHPNVALYGQSMGAAAILRAVSQNGIKPEAVILEAVFNNMLDTVRHRFAAMHVPAFPNAELLVFWGSIQAGFNGFAHNPVAYARALTCPALFMHGTDDPRALLKEARQVFDATPSPKQFKEFVLTGHESYLSRHPAEWQTTVSDFMKTAER